MEIRRAYLQMIKAFPGGWDSMSGALGMSKPALENRVYERKGQGVLVETAIQMQEFSGTTLFAEAIAQQSGGCFVQLPDFDSCDRQDLLAKFNELYSELGVLSETFREAIKDDVISQKEKRELTAIKARMHQILEELMSLAFTVFCRPEVLGEDD